MECSGTVAAVKRPVRRPPTLPPAHRARRRSRWALPLAIGLVGLVVCGIAALASLQLGGGTAVGADGATDRLAYSLVRPGQSQAQVIDLLGARPRAVESAPLGEGRRRCYVYERRSGRSGHYRFCFEAGVLVSKSRVDWPSPR